MEDGKMKISLKRRTSHKSKSLKVGFKRQELTGLIWSHQVKRSGVKEAMCSFAEETQNFTIKLLLFFFILS